MSRKSSKDSILDAAERLVARSGLKSATLEAVASEAGVSKGGIFYHFSSKQDMLLELIDRHVARYVQIRDHLLTTLPESDSRFLKASLLATLSQPVKNNENLNNILALLDDVELRNKIYHLKKQLLDDIARFTNRPERAALAVMAADGLWMADMYGKPLFSPEFRQRVVDELIGVIDEYSGGGEAGGGAAGIETHGEHHHGDH